MILNDEVSEAPIALKAVIYSRRCLLSPK